MRPSGHPPARKTHPVRWTLVALCVALATFYAVSCVRIARQQWMDESRPADAIVVFGAAEYAGRPSPIFRARLDHAFTLYKQNMARFIIVTGGFGDDPQYSEGGVGRDYLKGRGVPEDALIAETQSANTKQEAERVATIMRANGMRTCIAVSDAYHIFRIKAALERYGMEAYGAPRPEMHPLTRSQRVVLVMREGLSYMLWRMSFL
jgi:uncharacterized SAM-binding protein YcdF (DUF218 family)